VTVTYPSPVVSGGQPSVTVACSPASGAAFSIGSTAVTCTATDAAQRVASCQFNVVVTRAPRLSMTQFVAFGDSITWGEDGEDFCDTTVTAQNVPYETAGQWHPHLQFELSKQYPNVLQQELRNRYPAQSPTDVATVANRGCPGEQAGGVCPPTGQKAVDRFRTLVTSGSYQAVLLMEGANDINPDPTVTTAGLTGLQTMIRLAKTSRVRPFLATIPPEIAGRFYKVDPDAVRSFNARVRSLAVLESVTLVDVEVAFGASAGQLISCDGLHPNALGYQKIADTFFEILRATLEVSTSITSPTSAPFSAPPMTAPPAAVRREGRRG
jgi:lysophospholipase L1-like esterase